MTQLLYVFFTLMAFALIIITVHIRIGAIEKELDAARRQARGPVAAARPRNGGPRP
jgi:hypothetical protein